MRYIRKIIKLKANAESIKISSMLAAFAIVFLNFSLLSWKKERSNFAIRIRKINKINSIKKSPDPNFKKNINSLFIFLSYELFGKLIFASSWGLYLKAEKKIIYQWHILPRDGDIHPFGALVPGGWKLLISLSCILRRGGDSPLRGINFSSLYLVFCGEGEIRTPGRVAPTSLFESDPFNQLWHLSILYIIISYNILIYNR